MVLSDDASSLNDLDVDRIDLDDCPHRALPAVIGQRENRFQVVFRQSVLNEMHAHGRSVENTEICGVLVGNVFQDEFGPYLYVESSIRGEYASNESCNVTFTAETWNHIQGIMERDHADRRILGWYHTHPGFGIFLSDMDLFIHGNFFNLPWQVAYVYDPQRREEGLFVWRDGATEKTPYLLEADQTRGSIDAPDDAVEARESTPRWLTVSLCIIAFILTLIVGMFFLD